MTAAASGGGAEVARQLALLDGDLRSSARGEYVSTPPWFVRSICPSLWPWDRAILDAGAGLGDLARTTFPDKVFVPMCRLCPHMKAVTLERVLSALEHPTASQRIEVPAAVGWLDAPPLLVGIPRGARVPWAVAGPAWRASRANSQARWS